MSLAEFSVAITLIFGLGMEVSNCLAQKGNDITIVGMEGAPL